MIRRHQIAVRYPKRDYLHQKTDGQKAIVKDPPFHVYFFLEEALINSLGLASIRGLAV